ncbi:hypothetical protein ABIF50_004205 [Bradyrhizobium diazoefficiens]
MPALRLLLGAALHRLDLVAAEADDGLHGLEVAQRLADLVVAFDDDAVVELVLHEVEHGVVEVPHRALDRAHGRKAGEADDGDADQGQQRQNQAGRTAGGERAADAERQHEQRLERHRRDQARLQRPGEDAEAVEQRAAADDAGIDAITMRLFLADRGIDLFGKLALVGRQPGADRGIAGDLAVLADRRGCRQHPVEVAVLAAVLHRAEPRLAGLQRVPEIVERLRRHVGMTDDVVRLAHQLGRREAGGGEEILVEVGELALEVGPGDDQCLVTDRIFDISDRKILAHRSPQRPNSV